jgi:ubiquinone/menaquinone biosynthesis C-methylase UbiE
MNTKKTSWNPVNKWYDGIVGEKGHYYHQELIFPKLLPLLSLKPTDILLDIGCGQGVLSRQVPAEMEYVGMDIAPSLIKQAKQGSLSKKQSFIVQDAMEPWRLKKEGHFTHAVCMLAIQNMKTPEIVFKELSTRLLPGGLFAIILNHPCFRIPRQTRWGFDEPTKTQTRELFSYMSPQEIPITTHPGKAESEKTWSFHFPLSYYSQVAKKHGFVIDLLDEWVSPKQSTGSAKNQENKARREFPLFLCLLFRKAC